MRRLRVASVPATHVYVRRLAHPDVVRLEDPSGDDLRTPCFLDPGWVARHADELDVLHVHFGFEFYDPAQLATLVRTCRERQLPLVYTVHDLRNPNHATPELQDAGLDVLVPGAHALVTLTPAAAREVRRRWGRDALVLPHPHVVPLGQLAHRQARPRPEHRDGYRLGLHLKSLRANMDATAAVEACMEAARRIDGLRLRVDVHLDVAAVGGDNHDAALMQLLQSGFPEDLLDLHIHNYFSDDELWDHLESIDGFVLPYRFGTHSGLLEAAKDLGTAVLAPSCGAYADQGAHHGFRADEERGIDRASLVSAIEEAVRAGRPDPVPVEERRRERRRVADAHARLYADLAAGQGLRRVA